MVRKRAGIKGYYNHGLRHSFASYCRQGIDADAIRRALGHTTTSTTDRYAHHIDDSAMAQLRTLKLPDVTQSVTQSRAFSKKPHSEKEKKANTINILPGGPEGTRTPDLGFRKALLYPAELPGHAGCVVA
jgi:hypothetical protein